MFKTVTLFKTVTFVADLLSAKRQVARHGAKCAERAVAEITFNQNAEKCMQSMEAVDKESDMEPQFLSAVRSHNVGRVTALMRINECDVRFLLDSAADGNTICAKFVKKHQLLPSKQKLTMWISSTMRPLGEAVLDVVNPKKEQSAAVHFTVVDNGYTSLLGVNTIQALGLVTINKHAFIAPVTKESLGDIGEAKLRINPDARPRVLPCRRIPIALQEEVRQQVNELVERGVLVRVEDPTAWVSQMPVARKESDGSLRMCIDPQPSNAVLMGKHFKMPALDDVLPSLHNARVFTKLDVKEVFWHVRLYEQSGLLTTMITPFGRYRCARLPFGLSVSSEIFQKRLTEALDGLKGVICVADDIIVVRRGDTQAEAKKKRKKKREKKGTSLKT